MQYFMVFEDGDVIEEGEFVSMEETIQLGADCLDMEGESYDTIEGEENYTVIEWLETAYIMVGEKETLERYR